MNAFSAVLFGLGAYLVGAVPFGLVLGRALGGVDIRQHGSRNLGATNAFRVLGPRIGLAVLALDALKGALPVLLAPPPVAVVAGVAAIVGHVFPVYLGFRGGKGVATSAGVLAALAPVPTAVAFGVWAAVVAATRYVSLGSVLAAVALPVAVAVHGGPAGLTAAASGAAALVIVRHRANLGRLLRGTEPRFGARAAAEEDVEGTSIVGP